MKIGMCLRGITFGLAVFFPLHVCLAQVTFKDKVENKLENSQNSQGHWGLHFNSNKNTYQSAPIGTDIRKLNLQSTQESVEKLGQTQYDPMKTLLFHYNDETRDLALPDYASNFPTLNTETILSLIDTKEIARYLTQQISGFEGLSQEWQPHMIHIENLIQSNFHSIIDLPGVSEQIFNYIQDHDVAGTIPDFSQLQLDDLPWESFYNAENLQSLLEDYAQGIQLSLDATHELFVNTNTALENTVSLTIDQGIQTLGSHGFSFSGNKFTYNDPNAPENGFSFFANLDQSSIAFQSSMDPNLMAGVSIDVGDYITIDGQAEFDYNQSLGELSQEAQNQYYSILELITETLENGKPLGAFLEDFQNLAQDISQDALPIILANLQNNLETDLELTINFGALSESFEGQGTYQYVDVILETLANDVGSITFEKHDILYITQLMIEGRSENLIAEYVLEDVAGFETDVVGYNVARDVVNTFLSDHNSGKIIATQHSISGPGGMIRRQNSYFGSMKLHESKRGSWVATGSFNNRSFNNTPLLKEDGYLHLRTELQSHSIGIAYIPKIWSNPDAGIRLDGIVEVEGLFIRPISAKVLTKTELTSADYIEVLQLYDVPLQDIEETNKTYVVPMVSGGLNFQKKLSNVFAVNAFALFYPGLAQHGNLNEIPKAIELQTQLGTTLTVNINHIQPKVAPIKF